MNSKHTLEQQELLEQEQNIETFRSLLNDVSNKTSDDINKRLNESRAQAVEQLAQGHSASSLMSFPMWRPALALSVPALIVASLLLSPQESNQNLGVSSEFDIYADLELLADEEQLDFLVDLDFSEWMAIENDAEDEG